MNKIDANDSYMRAVGIIADAENLENSPIKTAILNRATEQRAKALTILTSKEDDLLPALNRLMEQFEAVNKMINRLEEDQYDMHAQVIKENNAMRKCLSKLTLLLGMSSGDRPTTNEWIEIDNLIDNIQDYLR